MSGVTHRLPRWQRTCLYSCGALLLFTGVAWLLVHELIGAGAGELPHPAEAWLMRLHGLGGFVALFLLGVLSAQHVPQGWRLSARQRFAHQRGTGLGLLVLGGLLAISGYALYYFAPEQVRSALGWLHAGCGLAMGALVLMHARGITRSRQASSL